MFHKTGVDEGKSLGVVKLPAEKKPEKKVEKKEIKVSEKK